MGEFRTKEIEYLDKKSASNYIDLIKNVRNNKVSLAFGAGVSASIGLPTWQKLLEKICYSYFEHWLFDIFYNKNYVSYSNPPKKVSISFTQTYNILELEKHFEDLRISEICENFDEFNYNESRYEDDFSGNKLNRSFDYKSVSKKMRLELEKLTKFEDFKRKELPKITNSFLNYDLLLIAQMIKNGIRPKDWSYLIRKSIYGQYEYDPLDIDSSELTDSLIQFLQNENILIKSILNYNYDDTFYHLLKSQDINAINLYKGYKHKDYLKDNLKIYYPHGYIPMKGGPVTDIVLSEEDYQNESFKIDNWSNNVQNLCFNDGVCIFLGLSFTDPNLRRLLKISKLTFAGNHYAFIPTKKDKTESQQMFESLFDYDLQRLGVKCIRYPLDDGDSEHKMLTKTLNLLIHFLNGDKKLF